MKYPTQYEAELVLEMNELLGNLSSAGIPDGSPILHTLSTARSEVHSQFIHMFDRPETSPWKVETKRNKLTVAWNSDSEAAVKIMGETD